MGQDSEIIFLRGKKVILRPINLKADLRCLVRWKNDPEILVNMEGYLPTTDYDIKDWVRSSRKRGDIILGIETAGIFIGYMIIHSINWRNRTAMTTSLIGNKEFWSGGYGTDAKMAILDYAFNTLNLRKLTAVISSFNKRSIKYNLRCGYKKEGHFREQIYEMGRYWDDVWLGILKKDWLPIWEHFKKTGEVK